MNSVSLSNAWEVFLLFAIPIGGGIPAGVLLAQNRGIHWVGTTLIYLLSDIVLACVFEPLMLLGVAGAKRSAKFARVREAFQKSVAKTTSVYGTKLGPLALILVSFGVDPMTGRASAAAVGHGFVTGWALAIAGDMLYYAVLMASTLWLHSILGDGTWTTIIILVLMMGVPALIQRFRRKGKDV